MIARSRLETAADRHEGGELAIGIGKAQPILAVDPARLGPDRTILAVRRGPVLEEIVALPRADTMTTVGRLGMEAHRRGVTRRHSTGYQYETIGGNGEFIVDVVGLGGGIVDRLKELGYSVAAFNGGSRPRDRKRFANARAEAYWRLRDLLETGAIALPRDEGLFEELAAVRWRPNSAGQIQIELKDDLRQRLGRSPDRADAAVMAFAFELVNRAPPDLPVLKW